MAAAAMLWLVAFLSLLDFFSVHGGYMGIINGTKVKPNSRLYMVSVQQEERHVCGGFLVNESFVMTAAHCIYKDATVVAEVTVVVGGHNIKKQKMDGKRKLVKYYNIHPKYNLKTYQNDIALLQLEERLKKSSTVDWIPLPEKDKDIKAASNCSVVGWGATKTKGPANDDLLEANVVIADRKKCQKQWKKVSKLSKEQLCASGQAAFCQGDSGGPLVCEGKAEGVVSYNENNKCDNPTRPNVYTRVSAYLPWIQKILKSPRK